jgi:hypothetical protein
MVIIHGANSRPSYRIPLAALEPAIETGEAELRGQVTGPWAVELAESVAKLEARMDKYDRAMNDKSPPDADPHADWRASPPRTESINHAMVAEARLRDAERENKDLLNRLRRAGQKLTRIQEYMEHAILTVELNYHGHQVANVALDIVRAGS